MRFLDYGINISVLIKNETEFNYWLNALPFYNDVRDEGGVISEAREQIEIAEIVIHKIESYLHSK